MVATDARTSSFARDFGLLEHFSTQELRVLFVQDTTHVHMLTSHYADDKGACVQAESRRSKLSLDEFVQLLGECTSKLEQQGEPDALTLHPFLTLCRRFLG